jgi:hypothetical protein
MKLVDLVQEISNLLLPLVELDILPLDDILKLHDSVSPHAHLLSGELQLSMSVVQPLLDLT